MQLFWRIMILATILWLAAMLLLATVPMAHGQSPLPTHLSTSWVATPGWTPTLHPWPPRTLTPTATPVPDQNIVYLPLIGGK